MENMVYTRSTQHRHIKNLLVKIDTNLNVFLLKLINTYIGSQHLQQNVENTLKKKHIS